MSIMFCKKIIYAKNVFNLKIHLSIILLILQFLNVSSTETCYGDDFGNDNELLTQLMQFINRNQNISLQVLKLSERLQTLELQNVECKEKINQFEQVLRANVEQQTSCVKGNDSAWIVIQRRKDGSEEFFRTWNEYKEGFGNKSGEFFIGLEILHKLTDSGTVYELTIDMETFSGENYKANYSHFVVGSESENYKLKSLGRYHGDAGDNLNYHLAQYFSTKDRRNDQNSIEDCANTYEGGWWYNECHESNLNGRYFQTETTQYAQGIHWFKVTDYNTSLKFVEMKIRPKPC